VGNAPARSQEKKLFCYLHAVQGDQYKLVVTYKIASVPPVDQVSLANGSGE
jgi:hypothetical protein